jgi:hypothetical protein
MSKIISIVIQAVVAFLIFVALNNIAILIMKREEIIDDPAKLVQLPLFVGWVETKGFADKQFNTYNRFATNYRKLPVSVNKFGGAQFTYTMWVKFDDISSENLSNKVLLLRGDKKKYPFSVTVNGEITNKNDYLVKSPLIKFGTSANELIVEFNTTKNMNERVVISAVSSPDETQRHNVFSLIPSKWMLMSFVFEDNRRWDDPEDGVLFRFYLNDILYYTYRTKGALRLNQGDLNILPASSISSGFLSDLTYYNYALNVNDIREVLQKGRTNIRYNEMDNDPGFNQPLYLSQYNKLEINNL